MTEKVMTTEEVQAALTNAAEQGKEVNVWVTSGLADINGVTPAENIKVYNGAIMINLNGIALTIRPYGHYCPVSIGEGFYCTYFNEEYNKGANYIEIFW